MYIISTVDEQVYAHIRQTKWFWLEGLGNQIYGFGWRGVRVDIAFRTRMEEGTKAFERQACDSWFNTQALDYLTYCGHFIRYSSGLIGEDCLYCLRGDSYQNMTRGFPRVDVDICPFSV